MKAGKRDKKPLILKDRIICQIPFPLFTKHLIIVVIMLAVYVE